MAFTATVPFAKFKNQRVKQTAVGTTADNNIVGGAAKISCIDVTHNGGASTKIFLHIWNDAAPTAASTASHICFPITNGQRQVVTISDPITFSNGVSWACGDAGGTGVGSAVSGGSTCSVTLIST